MTITLIDAYELFHLDCRARRLTKSTVKGYSEKLGAFIKWLGTIGIVDIAQLTGTHIKTYLVTLIDRGLKDTSQHDHARAIKTFCNFCVREELIRKSPFDRVKMPKLEDHLPVILNQEEIATALKKVRGLRNKMIIRFLLDSGVRAAELLALSVGDVDLVSGVVRVRLGKQQKERLTHIGNRTRLELKKYLMKRGNPSADKPLIVGERKPTRLSMIGLMSAFRLMQIDSGIETLTAHTLRRTMATMSLENGMNIHVLSKILGHSDLQMLKRYAVVSGKLIREQSEQFGVVDNLK